MGCAGEQDLTDLKEPPSSKLGRKVPHRRFLFPGEPAKGCLRALPQQQLSEVLPGDGRAANLQVLHKARKLTSLDGGKQKDASSFASKGSCPIQKVLELQNNFPPRWMGTQ